MLRRSLDAFRGYRDFHLVTVLIMEIIAMVVLWIFWSSDEVSNGAAMTFTGLSVVFLTYILWKGLRIQSLDDAIELQVQIDRLKAPAVEQVSTSTDETAEILDDLLKDLGGQKAPPAQ